MAKSKAKPTKTSKAKTVVKRAAAKAKPKARAGKASKAPKMPAQQKTTVAPYLAVGDATRAIQWYKDVFGAKVLDQMPAPDGRIMHASFTIGDTMLFLSDIFPQSDMVDPTRSGPSATMMYYRANAPQVWERAVKGGAKVVMPFEDQFWGDVYGKIIDPFGHSWAVATRSKLKPAQLEELRAKAMAGMGAPQ